MTYQAEDATHTTFVLVPDPNDEQAEVAVSRAALHLHTFGVLASVEAGDPGFVPDTYLSAISAETSVTALELWLAGLWRRVPCGYEVSAAETSRVAVEMQEQLRAAVARCLNTGGHVPHPQCDYMCGKCGAPMARSAA